MRGCCFVAGREWFIVGRASFIFASWYNFTPHFTRSGGFNEMGSFTCHCGYIIRDTVCPCPPSGTLMWEPEHDALGETALKDVESFLNALRDGTRDEWVRNYFLTGYPLDVSDAMVIDDIYSRASDNKGKSVYQCPECERLYLQKRLYENEWSCFEKAE